MFKSLQRLAEFGGKAFDQEVGAKLPTKQATNIKKGLDHGKFGN